LSIRGAQRAASIWVLNPLRWLCAFEGPVILAASPCVWLAEA
jgi:hypothetical protein